jgi:hypothetical protein
MGPTLGDLLADSPANSLSVHLGGVLPSGVPSLASLVEAYFAGYAPALFINGQQAQQANGWSLMEGSAFFQCLESSGFSPACIWVTYNGSAGPLLVAYAPLDAGDVSWSGPGGLTVNLTVSIFQLPQGT